MDSNAGVGAINFSCQEHGNQGLKYQPIRYVSGFGFSDKDISVNIGRHMVIPLIPIPRFKTLMETQQNIQLFNVFILFSGINGVCKVS